MRRYLACVSFLALVSAIPAFAAGPPAKAQIVTLDPAEAGPDFAVQGEYVDAERGAQVISLGDGKFHLVVFKGGLPGAGWDKTSKKEVDGATADGKTTFPAEYNGKKFTAATIAGDTLTLNQPSGETHATLKKTLRKSPTLGAKPPAGAVILFDGSSADNFQGGRLSPDGLLMEGATSKQKFQSFSIHLEFLLPFMPNARGQGRSNSGFYAQGRYETQILDSFGLDSQDNDCGGIYKVAKPLVNMTFPPLSWQTYDIDFTAAKYQDGKKTENARLTVRHNGVLIQDNVAVPFATTAAPVKEGPEPGPVFLQNHGNPVRFRNIWVVEKK